MSRQAAVEYAAQLVAAFRERFDTVTCGELVGGFPSMASDARKEHCARIVAFVGDWLGPALGDRPRP